LKWINKVNQVVLIRTGIVQRLWLTLMKGFDPLKMLTNIT